MRLIIDIVYHKPHFAQEIAGVFENDEDDKLTFAQKLNNPNLTQFKKDEKIRYLEDFDAVDD